MYMFAAGRPRSVRIALNNYTCVMMHRRGCAGGLKHGTMTVAGPLVGQTCANFVLEALTARYAWLGIFVAVRAEPS